MKKLLVKSLILVGMFLAITGCDNGETGPSQTGSSSEPTSQEGSSGQGTSQSGGETSSQIPVGEQITVYLDLGEIGRYDGQPGTEYPEVNLLYGVKLETTVGAALPGADKVSATSGATFSGWMIYEGNGAPTKYETVPGYANCILLPNFTGGSGEGGGGGGDPVDPSKPTTGMAIVVNGNTYYSLTNEGAWDMDPSYTQYSYKGVTLAVDDVLSFYDADHDAGWTTMAIDSASKGNLVQTASGLKVGTAGRYDVYIKMKSGNDNIYLGDA